jgi:hypothetical protein
MNTTLLQSLTALKNTTSQNSLNYIQSNNNIDFNFDFDFAICHGYYGYWPC